MSVATMPLAVSRLKEPLLTVDEYHRMIERGELTEDDRVELLEGRLVRKMPHNPPHADTIENINCLLQPVLPNGWSLRMQLPITLEDGEPEPDLAIVRRKRSIVGWHPTPPDVGLVIEVSDSTLKSDRRKKGRSYGRAALTEYWIVNLRDRQIERFRQPTGPVKSPGFTDKAIFVPGQTIELRLDGTVVATINVSDLLP